MQSKNRKYKLKPIDTFKMYSSEIANPNAIRLKIVKGNGYIIYQQMIPELTN